jgi:hypothetical protein
VVHPSSASDDRCDVPEQNVEIIGMELAAIIDFTKVPKHTSFRALNEL